MKRGATRPATTFAALLGVLMHALVLLSAGLASDAASAAGGDRSIFWSLCVNGQIVTLDQAEPGEGGQPAAPDQGMPACSLCAPSSGFALIPPDLPAVWRFPSFSERIRFTWQSDSEVTRPSVRPPARAPPYIA